MSSKKSKVKNKTKEKEEEKEETQVANIAVKIDEDEEQPKKTFLELGICKELADACTEMGFKYATDIQTDALPVALEGRDIIGLAKTGSGKTAAFGLPILQSLLKSPLPFYAVIISPTRELAFQIAEQIEALGALIQVKCCVLVGGLDTMQQAITLAGKPHIIVGTPGRMVYHLENTKGFNVSNLKYLVLDEADKLLNMDFEDELNTILAAIPKQRTTYLYSATMTTKVQKLQRTSLVNPVRIEVSTKYSTVDTLIQNYLFIPHKFKDCYVAYILNEFSGKSIIMFTTTIKSASKVTLTMRNLGFSAIPLHGKMSQAKRLGSLSKFKSGEKKILVATDVAARGLDIPMVDLVLNYDVPTDSKSYIHRVGRTARAGNAGKSITIVTQYDVELYQRIEGLIGKQLPQYETQEDEVLVFLERVTEAQRIASMALRDQEQNKKSHYEENDEDNKPFRKRKGTNKNNKSNKKRKFK